jgi:translation initiation factor 2B subunit (eIF-2B alpha/beta/delta family)
MSAHKRALLTPDSAAMRKLDALAAQMRQNSIRPSPADQREAARTIHQQHYQEETPKPNPTDGKIIELTAQLQEARQVARSLYRRNQELEAMLKAERIQVIDAPDYDCLLESDELELVGERLLTQFRR